MQTNLFNFGMIKPEPNIWDVILDLEYTPLNHDPTSALIFIYGTCWLSTSLHWFNCPDHMVI